MPCATGLAARGFHPVSEALAKLIAPASDRLVCHDHASLEEQFLDVAQAQLKVEIPAHSATGDLGRKPVTVIKPFRFLLLAILRDRLSNLTTPREVLGADQTVIESEVKREFFVSVPDAGTVTTAIAHPNKALRR